MKKIILFAAALAAFVACNKEQQQSGTFEKGQKVTLNVDASSSTKVTSADDGTNINFTWEEGDIIKVSVGGNDAEFTLKTGAGESSATFEGEMPAGGDTFDVQYPYETPDLSTQTYSSTEAIPHDKMLLKATGCSVDELSFSLEAQNAVLQLNLYDENMTISQIVVTDANSDTYTLNISPAVTLPTQSGLAKAFYIVVPTGNYKFTANVFDNAAKEVGRLKASSTQNFVANQILNMPTKKLEHKVEITLVYEENRGTCSASPSSGYSGEIVTLTATPAAGFVFANWFSTDQLIDDVFSASTTLMLSTSNEPIYCNFSLDF